MFKYPSRGFEKFRGTGGANASKLPETKGLGLGPPMPTPGQPNPTYYAKYSLNAHQVGNGR